MASPYFVVAVTMAGAAPALPQVSTCAACHGADGLGNAGARYPALAWLAAPYLKQQLYSFKHGTRENVVMTAIAKGLNAGDRETIAAYYEGLNVPAKPEPKPLTGDERYNSIWNCPKDIPYEIVWITIGLVITAAGIVLWRRITTSIRP